MGLRELPLTPRLDLLAWSLSLGYDHCGLGGPVVCLLLGALDSKALESYPEELVRYGDGLGFGFSLLERADMAFLGLPILLK